MLKYRILIQSCAELCVDMLCSGDTILVEVVLLCLLVVLS